VTAHNSRNESNIRNEINNRTAIIVGTPATAGMHAEVVKRPTTAETPIISEMTAASGTILWGTSWMSTAAGPPYE
jgi:hypothetical protein